MGARVCNEGTKAYCALPSSFATNGRPQRDRR
jgi:hypothetical protein